MLSCLCLHPCHSLSTSLLWLFDNLSPSLCYAYDSSSVVRVSNMGSSSSTPTTTSTTTASTVTSILTHTPIAMSTSSSPHYTSVQVSVSLYRNGCAIANHLRVNPTNWTQVIQRLQSTVQQVVMDAPDEYGQTLFRVLIDTNDQIVQVISRQRGTAQVFELPLCFLDERSNQLKRALDNNPPINRFKQRDYTADKLTTLLWCAFNEHVYAIPLLVEYGADINECDAYGNTALHMIMDNNDIGGLPIVFPLLTHGLDPCHRTLHDRETCMTEAETYIRDIHMEGIHLDMCLLLCNRWIPVADIIGQIIAEYTDLDQDVRGIVHQYLFDQATLDQITTTTAND